jgi:arabinose-5-phosphate isomerase
VSRLELGREVLRAEAAAIEAVSARLGDPFEAAVDALLACPGRLVVCGMGKSGLVGRKLVATFSSTGTPALFLHPAEAVHGDLGGVVPGDVVLLLSYGGETEEIVRILPFLREVASKLVAICGRTDSTLARQSDVSLDVSVPAEACPLGLAPTASSTATLAMGDALAMAVMIEKGFSAEAFGKVHPGGNLGRRFLKAKDLMYSGEAMPAVSPTATVREVIAEIAAKGQGMTTVIDADRLVGVITDGDIRRLLERTDNPLDIEAAKIMSRHPHTINEDMLALHAAALMDEKRVTVFVVVDDAGRPAGVLKSHDMAGRNR